MLLAVGLVVLWVALCVRLVQWHHDHVERAATEGPRLAVRARLPRQCETSPLPEGHRPPPGLGPLSPSERFLRAESARGLRDLQAWLVDQADA